jgi:hypothetical protein
MMRRRGVYALTIAVTTAAAIAAAGVEAATAHAKPAGLTWHSYRVSGAGPLAAVQCPSTRVCVAITKRNQLWTTRNASAPHPSWKPTTGLKVMGPEENFEQQSGFNLSCPSTHLCVTSDHHKILTTTNPTGPKSAWKSTDIQPAHAKAEGKIDSLSCSSATLCVAGMNEWVNEEGGGTYLNFATSTNPTGGRAAWSIVKAAKADYMTSLSCGPGGVCAGGDEYGAIFATPNARAGGASWSQVGLLPSTLDWQTCPSAKLCVGVDDTARPVVSTSPGKNGSWVRGKLPQGDHLGIVACAGASFCVATGFVKNGPEMFTSTHPASAAGWRPHPATAGQASLTGLQCRTRSWCIGVGKGGLVERGTR